MNEQKQPIQRDVRLQTRQLTPELITYIVEKIADNVSPRQVILFGSYAQGEATESSDLDLFIVQDGQQSNRAIRQQIERLLWGRHFGLDLIVRNPDEVSKNIMDGNPFYTQHIFTEGKILYERPT